MKTLTITDAKKNLGKWLQAAADGEDVAIISGANIIALRKVEVEATDYAWKEYGVTPQEIEVYERHALEEHKKIKAAGKLRIFTEEDIRRERDKTFHHSGKRSSEA